MANNPKLTSGDWLIDWFFEKFVTILNHPDFELIGVPHLKLPGKHKCDVEVWAYMEGDNCLFFNTSWMLRSSHDKKGVTLCHELLHVLFRQGILPRITTAAFYDMEPVRHRDIYVLERLWERLSRSQQDLLLSFFPCTRKIKRG